MLKPLLIDWVVTGPTITCKPNHAGVFMQGRVWVHLPVALNQTYRRIPFAMVTNLLSKKKIFPHLSYSYLELKLMLLDMIRDECVRIM